MKALGKILLYLLATVALGALLAAPLYWGGQWLASQGVLSWLETTPFRKFFHRGLLVAALALLWPVARWLRVPNLRALGIAPNPLRWRDIRFGFGAAFLLMALYAALLFGLGFAEGRNRLGGEPVAIALAVGKIFLSAGVVAFLEEWLFRGALLGLFQRGMRAGRATLTGSEAWRADGVAVLACSALFAILHFLKPDTAAPAAIHWWTGFTLIPGAFRQFEQPWLLLGGFSTLFCVGAVLAWARLRTGSLWLPIGLHMGWVVGEKLFNKTTWWAFPEIGKNELLPWLGDKLIVGLGAVSVVLLTGAAVGVYLRRRGEVSPAEP